MSALVFERSLSTAEMLAVFGEASVLQTMLDVEAALARAQAAQGVIPEAAARAIVSCCKVEWLDSDGIINASRHAGSLVIPLVKHLTAKVAHIDSQAAGFVHWGSTSQDVMDTAMSLLARRALGLIDRDLRSLIDALITLAQTHASVPVLARTLMQPAQVVSLGFKLLAWVAPLQRCRERLHEISKTALQLQLGGAVGTMAVMGHKGAAVAQHMATDLQLALPQGTWHTQRDEAVTLACQVGVLCGALGKVAKDISLMSQAEVGELNESGADSRGGSSAMPHKRNPVACLVALAAALRAPQRVAALLTAMAQEHERGLGNWQAELAETAGLYLSAHGAVKALADAALAGLEVHPQRMRVNIDALNGLVSAEAVASVFAVHIGKAQAHALLEVLSAQVAVSGTHLRELCLATLQSDNRLLGRVTQEEVELAFDNDLAAQVAVWVAAPQLAALRVAASCFKC